MRQFIFTICTALSLVSTIGIAQKTQMVNPKPEFTSYENKGSIIQLTEPGTEDQPFLNKDSWMVTLQNFGEVHHATVISKDEFKKRKKELEQQRRSLPETSIAELQQRSAIEAPVMERNFKGNLRNGSVPMDNSMAISRNGFIVSGINTNLIFTQPDGVVRYGVALSDFFKITGLGTRMYDPRIIYDTETNKFIIMCMHGTEPSNTALSLAFSQTEDPTGRWNYYKIDGNPLDDQFWSDYPNVSISTDDLYITTLLRDLNGDWNYSMVFQISKTDGYDRKPLRWKYYANPLNADGKKAFNLVPPTNGESSLIGPGMHFVSNEALGGNTYNYYRTTGNLDSNPSLLSYQTTGLPTQLAPNGRQKNSGEMLNTFDSRIWSATYNNGIIHMGGHVDTPNKDVGLLYGRFDIQNLKVDAQVLTEPNIDYGFPSFSTFGDDPSEDQILVNYLFSGTELLPSQGQRIVSGTGSTFEWSDQVVLKEGLSAINALTGQEERWGDYSTSCRRYFDNRTEAWSVGMHGESNNYATWLGQFFQKSQLEKPRAEFVADNTTVVKLLDIKFTDLTPDQPSAWQWSFPGATPTTSNVQNPTVRYAEDGAYDVQLIVTTSKGIDTIWKEDYIHIQDPLLKPKADFTQDSDTIYSGQQVKYTSTSTGEIYKYNWTFQGGSPPKSEADNQVVTYNNPGSYLASLLVENTAGSNTKIKSKAVTVLQSSNVAESLDIPTKLYPNPVGDNMDVSIDFNLDKPGHYSIYMTDIQGRLIKELWNGSIKAGENTLQFSPYYLAKGTYHIIFQSGNKAKQIPFIKQ